VAGRRAVWPGSSNPAVRSWSGADGPPPVLVPQRSRPWRPPRSRTPAAHPARSAAAPATDWATICIHVPVRLTACPARYSRKFGTVRAANIRPDRGTGPGCAGAGGEAATVRHPWPPPCPWGSQAAPSACLGEVLGELAVVERIVDAVAAEQVGVVALLDDAPGVHHDDRVRVADGRQPVGDDKAGPALPQP
jgi:hypothetical protein